MNAASTHPEPLSTPEEQPESSQPPDKGFRFFYFEEDLIFNVTTSQADAIPTAIKSRPAPVLQSAIPYRPPLSKSTSQSSSINIINFNHPLIISNILNIPLPVDRATTLRRHRRNRFSARLGGVVIHFGSESQQTIARLADWKLTKSVGQDTLSISIGKVEVLSSTGSKILLWKNLDD